MAVRLPVPVLVSVLVAVAAVGIGLFFALQPQDAQATDPRDPRTFTVDGGGVDGAGTICPHTITFQGKSVNPDGSTTWSYLLVNKNGTGCGTSHWVLELCQDTPSVYDAFVSVSPATESSGLTPKTGDPGTTGLVGVKWNDISNGFTDPPGATFTVTLNQDFAIDKNVPIGIKVGEVTDGVIFGSIEGPACEKPPTPTPTDTPTPIGGIGLFPDVAGGTPLETADSSGGSAAVMAALIAAATAAVIALASAAWYARRRWLS